MTPLITTSKFSFAYANFEVGIQPTGAAKKENVLALHCDSDPDPRKLTCYFFFCIRVHENLDHPQDSSATQRLNKLELGLCSVHL